MNPLELRLKLSERISNLSFDLLERLYEGQAALKDYVEGVVESHIHWTFWVSNLTFNENLTAPIEVGGVEIRGVVRALSPESRLLSLDSETHMLILVGDFLKELEPMSPVCSVVRLQPLDSYRMRVIDSIETAFAPSPESAWRLIDRELRVLLLRAGIKNGKLVDEVVETRSEVVSDLADQCRDSRRNRWAALG